MEYSIIANLVDGRQLTASGYRTFPSAMGVAHERVANWLRSNSDDSKLNSIVIVGSDGGIAYLDGEGKAYGRAQQQIQNWLAAEKVAS